MPTRELPPALMPIVPIVAALLLPAAALAQNAGACGQLENAYGPFDYRVDQNRLPIVELHHFTPEVELLIRGREGPIGGDLDYVLRAFPNHPRALLAMARYGDKLKVDTVPNARYSVDCYFVRAITFQPEDTTARMLYATYLNSHQRRDDALKQLAVARGLAGDNGFTHYNLGLVYMDLREFDLALAEAHAALALGFPRTELRDRLVAANKWAEPASAPPP